jgi:murein DD-endopeptidase MepM/ murein hydrolase activator NlpD
VSFPKPHLFLAGALSLALASFVVLKFSEDDTADRFTSESVLLAIPDTVAAGADEPPDLTVNPADSSLGLETIPATALAVEREQTLVTRSTKVKAGDSLAKIFQREGIPPRDLALLLESKPFGPRLKKIFPGHEFTFGINANDQLTSLAYSPGPLDTLQFELVGDEFVGEEVHRQPERITSYKHAVIDHSLFIASQRAGLDDSLTMRIAQIFQWDIDFVLDIRKGDEFYVLFEELYLGDDFIGYGNVLAAEFINQGTSYQAFGYQDARGSRGYYSPEGKNMKKAFLRAPVEFSRISSNFNLRRKHPLYKRTMPHRGIDYAAPRGTPILAAGDGKVITASRSNSNGNFVVLQHGEEFVTKYLHLSKFANGVKKGKKVEQGSIIGYVGSTGWATGPHLHYEFLVNGSHMNPRTVKLPDANPIPSGEQQRFAQTTDPILSLLEDFKHQTQLALAR